MKENLSEFIYIIDRSGSMSNIWTDTIGGYNSLIANMKEADGEAYVTTILFDNGIEKVVDHVKDVDVQPLDPHEYMPRYTTALLDAIGSTIDNVGLRLYNTPEEERPSHVVVTIITDGYENASKDYKKSQIKDMIALQRDVYSWEFIFLGADIDAFEEASSIGIDPSRTQGFTKSSACLDTLFSSVGEIAVHYKNGRVGGATIQSALNKIQ